MVLSLHNMFKTAVCFQKDADSLKIIGREYKNGKWCSVLSG